ncbi:multiheme c-type cytochrome [Fuerstiella marisgermanici]|uniref:Formate-dependent nitrite reductase, periplasmic cytochrome c552 subunit n=1 Tax=Fuerstiella marisgermanici TaxID=1891926 RepID=A0A1P8WK01_9PLAN|nr:multiheme c-type cytochrome [Fuerstiella marisgermanici]APZ94379.1 Formate-dependent nitrite reductase, periplasmic cytochrome c552 subunit [Fuerstiella marisgermanici]
MPRMLTIITVIVLAASLGLFLLSQQKEPFNVEGGEDQLAQTQPQSVVEWRKLIDSRFAGDQACAECHQSEFDAHQRSGHSRTATPADHSELARALDGQNYTDPNRDTVYQFERKPNGLLVGIEGTDPEPVFPVQWLIGSGTHAQTPVSIDPTSRNGVEFRWSWFASTQELGLTPDHERFDTFRPASLECFGRPMDAQQVLACVNCHMTAVPPPTVVPTQEAFLPNVGCERCHGPRKDHVELAKQGRASEAKPLLEWSHAETYLRQCAQCHRDETNAPTDSTPASLARFQPYGILKSKCYLNSGKKLSCANCHDPHDVTSRDPEHYVQACNACHAGPKQVACSLNPDGDCVDCHMPTVEWHPGISFHDHWIRLDRTDPKDDARAVLDAVHKSSPEASP